MAGQELDRGSRAWLTLQWRNAIALLVGGLCLGALGAIIVAFVGLPGGDALILGLAIVGIAAPFAGCGVYLLRVVGQGEARLRGMGVRWQADRSLVGTTRRSLVTSATPEASLAVAREILSDPELGLTHVANGLFGGLRAIRPAETGPIVVSVVPLEVRIRARERQGQTAVSISIVQSSLYGWPVLSGWVVGWSAAQSWIGAAQELAEELATALARRLNGRLE